MTNDLGIGEDFGAAGVVIVFMSQHDVSHGLVGEFGDGCFEQLAAGGIGRIRNQHTIIRHHNEAAVEEAKVVIDVLI